MSTLISMCCYDTVENQRSIYTKKTIDSLLKTTNNRIIVVDNNSCEETKEILLSFGNSIEVVTLPENIGTARAINTAWAKREPGQHCIKIDNDVVINKVGWVDDLEFIVNRCPQIGQIGLKRKDLWENPYRNDDFKSEVFMLEHNNGEHWYFLESVKHVIGTCVLHSSALLDKVGYLYQPTIYGFDDCIMSKRSLLAGFINCFIPEIDIDYLDDGLNPYQKEKEDHASKLFGIYSDLIKEYESGIRPLYQNIY